MVVGKAGLLFSGQLFYLFRELLSHWGPLVPRLHTLPLYTEVCSKRISQSGYARLAPSLLSRLCYHAELSHSYEP